ELGAAVGVGATEDGFGAKRLKLLLETLENGRDGVLMTGGLIDQGGHPPADVPAWCRLLAIGTGGGDELQRVLVALIEANDLAVGETLHQGMVLDIVGFGTLGMPAQGQSQHQCCDNVLAKLN